jgi:cation transport protein ChaC
MALTPAHVAQVHRVLDDPGPDLTWTYHTDEDYAALVRGLLASHPDGPDTWLFAYGSLIWKPELEHVELRRGTARGWHRSFCFREITVKPPNNIPRWISVETDEGPLRAIAFVMNRQSRFYTGRLSLEEIADVLARACGHWGSCAEYLHNTVAHLEEQGIRDRDL